LYHGSGNDLPISQQEGKDARIRLSVRLLIDKFGTFIGRQAHLPFGEDFAESGSQEKHHFTTYERDSETGTDYAINRGYDYVTGRFPMVARVPLNATAEPTTELVVGAARFSIIR
jgi:hypothetical protein